MRIKLFICLLITLSSILNASQKGFTRTFKGVTMEKAVQAYAEGADSRNTKLLNQVFHEDFRVNALTKEGLKTLDKKTYLTLMEKGKIGGTKRVLEILSLNQDGVIGTVQASLKAEKVTFYDNITLINKDGDWQIISNVTRVVPN